MDRTRFYIDSYLAPHEAFHFARKSLARRYPAQAHDHDFFEVFLIESGRTAHWINGVSQSLQPGQIAFLRPRDVHAFCADRTEGCQIINVMFRTETAQHLAARYRDTVGGRLFDATSPLPDMQALGPDAFARAKTVALQLQTADRSLARIEEFLLVLANRVVFEGVPDTNSVPRWFSEACNAAQTREVFRKGAAGFIKAAGRSHEHVCRTCKSATGLTPSEYVNRIRIDHAAQLLRSDEAAIEDIVEECGFENLSYFYRLFRKQYGTTPKAYRKAKQRDPFQA